MDFRLLLFPLVSVIFRYSQRVSAFYFDDTCKTVFTNFYMCFLLFRLRFLCLTFKMNHNALFIMSQFHNSKLSSQTRTLSKGTYPVDLHYRRLLSAGMA